MELRRLAARNFRNFRELNLEIPSGTVILVGANGQGKTNLIEALYVLLRGSSFRPSTVQTLLYSNENQLSDAAMVSGHIEHGGLTYDLRMTFAEGKKTNFLNSHRVRATS